MRNFLSIVFQSIGFVANSILVVAQLASMLLLFYLFYSGFAALVVGNGLSSVSKEFNYFLIAVAGVVVMWVVGAISGFLSLKLSVGERREELKSKLEDLR